MLIRTGVVVSKVEVVGILVVVSLKENEKNVQIRPLP